MSVLPSTSSSCDSSAGSSLSSREVVANWPGESQRLVARDRRDPGRGAVGRAAAVTAPPGANRRLLGGVLGGPGRPEHAASLAQALRTDEAPIPVGQRSPRQRCNELNGQEGLPSMTSTLESDATRAYAVLAPAYDLLTAEYAYGPWLHRHRACRARPRARRGPPARRRLRHRQELPAPTRARLPGHGLRHLAGHGGARVALRREVVPTCTSPTCAVYPSSASST